MVLLEEVEEGIHGCGDQELPEAEKELMKCYVCPFFTIFFILYHLTFSATIVFGLMNTIYI